MMITARLSTRQQTPTHTHTHTLYCFFAQSDLAETLGVCVCVSSSVLGLQRWALGEGAQGERSVPRRNDPGRSFL